MSFYAPEDIPLEYIIPMITFCLDREPTAVLLLLLLLLLLYRSPLYVIIF